MNTITRHNSARKRVQIQFGKKGRTKQSFAAECDINNIMAKYQKTGAITHVNQHGAQYGFATSADFTDAMRLTTQAQEMFDGLPSSIRTRFANDPAQFLDFVQDANNEPEMRKLGILPDDKPPENLSDEKKEDTPTPDTPPVEKPEEPE